MGDTWKGLTKKTPVRNPAEHITITVVLYFTVANGVPSEADVLAAIDDMEKLYDSCTGKGRLAEEKFDFMKSELTVKDVKDIHEKLVAQPPFNRLRLRFITLTNFQSNHQIDMKSFTC